MRRLTAWIYGLLTAALLVFSAHRYWEVRLQLSYAERSLEQLEESAARLQSENSELTFWIGEAEIADGG